VSFLAWERDQSAELEKPIFQANKFNTKRFRFGRAETAKRAAAAKAKKAAEPKVRKKRDKRFLSKGEMIRIKKNRQAFAADMSPSASTLPVEERQRRERIRHGWAAEESRLA